ncbi:MAG TPA: 3-hydroxyacyl-CoA dehydrogenase family protein [Bryobacteraceae bacterium]|nr:3-hydroxyacyl-CoA dehydrogenase family protein [Bryobacteraceae bacterium]
MGEIRFESAAVIGTGMMGPGIAVTLALGGLRVAIVSRTQDGAVAGLEKASEQVRLLEENALLTSDRVEQLRDTLSATANFDETVAGADLVVESGPENMEFKQELFKRMESLVPPSSVLASNTSSLSITAVASKCRHPERVLTTHFWNPPHLMPLVEIVKGEQTPDEVARAVRDLLAACGKVPVMVRKDRPGQLGNRLQMALWREAVNIVQEGIADAADVDLAAKLGFGIRLPVYGIFEHADAVGLDMVHGIMDYTAKDLYNQPQAPPLMKELVARRDLGVKTGRGFYDWSKKDIKAVLKLRDRFVLEFLKSEFGHSR